ncbi:MAG: hypothetical protein HY569_02610 [Candidatus Magasanikbacteria bacterium]|nr:hypothetical protein [Candidatus Magasanikbacteria bacterium]
MKHKNILLSLPFIFSAFGFLFFKADFAFGADGMCTCDIVHTDTGEKETDDVSDKSQAVCYALEGTAPFENQLYKNCLWQDTGGTCQCKVKNTLNQEITFEKIDGIGTEEKCKNLVTETSGGETDVLVNESCEWVGGAAPQPITTEGSESAIDLPSVAGLNKLKNTDVKAVFGNIISVAMGLLGSIALALFAYAGVLWMLAGGNAERSTQAKNIVVWATLGLFVIFASYTIVSFIFSAVE